MKIILTKTLFILIFFVQIPAINGQKIIKDTMLIFDPCYIESVLVCEMLVPDTAYQRLVSIKNNIDLGSSKYDMNCHYLIPGEKANQYYSYKDFQLCIGENCFEYNFPMFDFTLDKNSLIENLDSIYLLNTKTGKAILQLQLTIVFTKRINYKNSKTIDLNNISVKDKKLIYTAGKLEIVVPSFSFNYEDKRHECVNNIFHFPEIRFNLYGRDKYPELNK